MTMVFYPITAQPTVNSYVCSRLDNYYDANGLSDFEEVPDGVNVFWNEDEEPQYASVMENINRWIEELASKLTEKLLR